MTTARNPTSGSAGASTPPVRNVVGVMTGTSIDGIDIALARIEGRGLDMRATLAWHDSQGLGELGPQLRQAAEQQPMTAGQFARLAWDFGLLHANAIAASLKKQTSSPPDLIVAHGQTVFHQPQISWQILNPAPIAARFDCPVVCDLRQADLAAGGQGAPITPLADWVLFRHEKHRRAIVNLGGFCNVTVVPSSRAIDEIRGFDVCACNHILDSVARRALAIPLDRNGEAASGGRVHATEAEALLALLTAQRAERRSLGTRDEVAGWIEAHVAAITGADLAATAVDAIARCVASALKEHRIDEVILAGGGALNRALTKGIAQHSGAATQRSDALGVPVQAREALCMAVLGALSADGVPITLPQVTSCQRLHVAGIRTM